MLPILPGHRAALEEAFAAGRERSAAAESKNNMIKRKSVRWAAMAAAIFAGAALGAGGSSAAPSGGTPKPASYKQQAEAETDFIQAHFWDGAAKRYRPSFPVVPGQLQYDVMWGNGVQFSALAAAAREDPAKYRQPLSDFADGLAAYWDPTAAVPCYQAYCSGPGGNDKYYDDNEWMVLGFTEAYQNTGSAKYLKMAQDTQKFVLSGWDDLLGGGIYWKIDHQSKNTCSNAPAAASALRLDQVTGDRQQGAWGIKLCDWTTAHLEDADGLFWDNVKLSGEIQKWKFSYNTALMIRTHVLLYQLRHTPADLQEARREADAGLAAWTDPATGSLQKTENSPRFTHLFCEALLRLYDVSHDAKYLNAVRQQAAFAEQYARDPKGGYRDHWTVTTKDPNAPNSLIENASAARLFWLLAPYPDPAELTAAGRAAAGQGKEALAEALLRQAADSDRNAVETRYYLWKILARAKKPEAASEAARLVALAQNPAAAARLRAAGWKP